MIRNLEYFEFLTFFYVQFSIVSYIKCIPNIQSLHSRVALKEAGGGPCETSCVHHCVCRVWDTNCVHHCVYRVYPLINSVYHDTYDLYSTLQIYPGYITKNKQLQLNQEYQSHNLMFNLRQNTAINRLSEIDLRRSGHNEFIYM